MWSELIATWIDQVRLNSTRLIRFKDKDCFLKTRLPFRNFLIFFGNIFLSVSNSRIQMFGSTQKWLEWEIGCYQILYPSLLAQSYSSQALVVEKIPGKDLLSLLKLGKLTEKHLLAAAMMFKRAHQCHSTFFNAGWSHGDPHLENVLFDSKSKQAFVIDFETQHVVTLSANERQADDLLVFCLDLIGRSADYESLLTTFFSAYGDWEILHTLQHRLSLPQGFEHILWLTRTNFLSQKVLEVRLQQLRKSIHEIGKK